MSDSIEKMVEDLRKNGDTLLRAHGVFYNKNIALMFYDIATRLTALSKTAESERADFKQWFATVQLKDLVECDSAWIGWQARAASQHPITDSQGVI